jgi:type I restriction enzyme S subunit
MAITSNENRWSNDLPQRWKTRLLKYKLRKITDGAHVSPDTSESAYPFVSTVNIENGAINFESCLQTSAENFSMLRSQGCRPKVGDVLFSKDGTVGRTALISFDKDFVVASSLIILTPTQAKVFPAFLDFMLRSHFVLEQINSFVKGSALRRVSLLNIKKVIGVFPPVEEQIRIASYLNKTCAAIDKTIEVKQKQLEILDALRKSIIHKAVTRGLDDSVELKDSGVEWLGRIPKHWFITKLKNQCQIIPSNVDKKSHDDETEVRLCNYVDVYYNEFIDNSIEYMVATANEHELKKFQLLEGDVLLTKDSEDPHDIAVPALVIRTQPKFLCGYHLSIIRSNNQKFNGSYLFWALKDVFIASQLHREATGITRWAIANRHVKNSTIPLPPDTEQKLIASYLNKKCVELSKLHEYIEQQILTLEQYRKSLIHECVTGKQRITANDMQDQL